MNPDSQRSPKRNPWRKVGLVFLALFTIILVIVSVAYSRTDLASAAGSIDTNRKAAEKYLSLAKASYPQIPESENARPLIEAAVPPILDRSGEIDEAYIQKNRLALTNGFEMLRQASKRQGILSPATDSDGEFFGSKSWSKISAWVKILTAMARYDESKGDLAGTEESLSLAAFLAIHVADEPSSIALLLRISNSAVIEATIKRFIPKHAHDTNWLGMFRRVMLQLDRPYDFRGLLAKTYQSQLKEFQAIAKEDISLKDAIRLTDIPLSMRFAKYLPRSRQAFESRIHERYALVAGLTPTEPYDFKTLAKAAKAGDDFSERQGWSYDLVRLMSIDLLGVVRAIRKEVSIRNALLQAIEILATQADPSKGLPLKGRYALDLDDQPIRIKHLPKGWILYSIWGDEVDDDGQEMQNGHGDYIVHLSPATVPPPVKSKPLSFP